MKHIHSRYRGEESRGSYFSSFRKKVFALRSTGRHLLRVQFITNPRSYIQAHRYNQVRTPQKSAVLTRTHMTQLHFSPVYFKWNTAVTGHIHLKLWISAAKALSRTKPFLWVDCRTVCSLSVSRTERLPTQNSGNRHSWERSSFGSSVCLEKSHLPFKACQKLYVPPDLTFKNSTWWLHSVCVFSKQTATYALHNINSLAFTTEAESVYSAVRTESLYNTYTFRL